VAVQRIGVVGDGLIGTCIAYALTDQGYQVHLFGADEPSAAWRAAAGMLSPGGELQGGELALLTEARRALDLWPAFASRLRQSGVQVTLHHSGTLVLGALPSDRKLIEAYAAEGTRAGYSPISVDRDELPQLFRHLSPRIQSAGWYEHEAVVDPQELVHSLRLCLQEHGVCFAPPAHGISGTTVTAGTTAETFDCVIQATGAWPLEGPLEPVGTRPVRGCTILVGEGPDEVLPTVRGYVEGRPFYIASRGQGRFVVGASAEEERHQFARVQEISQLLDDAVTVMPILREMRLLDVRVGWRSTSADNFPEEKEASDGNLLRLGNFYRHGVLFAPLAVERAVEFVASC
jgi:glycine oxidase